MLASLSKDFFNTLALARVWGFSGKKTPKCTWRCAGISPLWFGLRTWSKHQKMRQVFLSALEKKCFAVGVRVVCEWHHK